VVAVGYLAAGWPGAIAAWLALVTPAFAAVPLLATVQRWLHLPRVRSLVDAVVVAGAALLVPSGVSLAVEAMRQLLRLR
jgi:chromate transporter